MSCGVTDQKATDGDTRRDTDSGADSMGASDDQPQRRSRLDEITRQADEQVDSDKAKQKQDKQEAREQKKAERAERRAAKKADKDEKAEKGDKPKGKGGKDQGLGGQVSAGVSAVRNRIASIVWLIAVLCAVILAIGALLAALSDNINESNPVVEFINETAEALDGPFGNIITFEGRDDRTKEVLVNWGLAALAYLIVGRILDRLIRT